MPKQPAQPDAPDKEAARREKLLSEMDAVVPWKRLLELIESHCPTVEHPPTSPETMLRGYFLRNWRPLKGLVDWDSRHDSEATRRFAGIESGDDGEVPESEISKFKELLEKHRLPERLFAEATACLLDKVIADIRKACKGGEAFFRGEYRSRPEKGRPASSVIYRKHNSSGIFQGDHHQPSDVEKEIVEQARGSRYFSGISTVDILTDLRHLGADTAIVDFSKDMLVALFFACNGEPKKGDDGIPTGSVWVLPKGSMKELNSESIYGESRPNGEDGCPNGGIGFIIPARTGLSRNRVDAQSSIFIHARQGFVNKDCMEEIKIPGEWKEECLDYLERFHDISRETIYNDPLGFVQNEKNFETSSLKFYAGNSKAENGNRAAAAGNYGEAARLHEAAIADYDEAISLRSRSPSAFYNRGNSRYWLGGLAAAAGNYGEAARLHEAAIADYDEAISQQPEFPSALNNRGNSKSQLGDRAAAAGNYGEAARLHEAAIADYDEAISQRPKDPKTLNNRGNSKYWLGNRAAAAGNYGEAARLHEAAIADYDEAISQQPEFPSALNNRGNSKSQLGDRAAAAGNYGEAARLHEAAIADYDEAISQQPEFPKAVQSRDMASKKLARIQKQIP